MRLAASLGPHLGGFAAEFHWLWLAMADCRQASCSAPLRPGTFSRLPPCLVIGSCVLLSASPEDASVPQFSLRGRCSSRCRLQLWVMGSLISRRLQLVID